MSYSYIKSVFPKFEHSTVYDDKLYKNLNMDFKPGELKPIEHMLSSPQIIQNTTSIEFTPISREPVQSSMQMGRSHLVSSVNPYSSDVAYAEPQARKGLIKKQLEEFDPEISTVKSGLQSYNIPMVNNEIPNYNNLEIKSASVNPTSIQPSMKIDNINSVNGVNNINSVNSGEHESYIKHIMECNICKQRVLKQFNIETERIRNEEIMELISYIMFGVFILILLDRLKK